MTGLAAGLRVKARVRSTHRPARPQRVHSAARTRAPCLPFLPPAPPPTRRPTAPLRRHGAALTRRRARRRSGARACSAARPSGGAGAGAMRSRGSRRSPRARAPRRPTRPPPPAPARLPRPRRRSSAPRPWQALPPTARPGRPRGLRAPRARAAARERAAHPGPPRDRKGLQGRGTPQTPGTCRLAASRFIRGAWGRRVSPAFGGAGVGGRGLAVPPPDGEEPRADRGGGERAARRAQRRERRPPAAPRVRRCRRLHASLDERAPRSRGVSVFRVRAPGL